MIPADLRAVAKSAPPSPGAVLRQLIVDERGLSQAQAAHLLGISAPRLSMLLNGKSPMSPEVALRLAWVFETPAKFWLDVRSEFELYQAGQRWSKQLQNLGQLPATS
jgi:addiction module HigA family antidote